MQPVANARGRRKRTPAGSECAHDKLDEKQLATWIGQRPSSPAGTSEPRAPSDSDARANGMSGGTASQDPDLLRRLLRAKDRMDAASHEDWPVRRLARVSAVSEAHFARSFKQAFGVPPHRYLLRSE